MKQEDYKKEAETWKAKFNLLKEMYDEAIVNLKQAEKGESVIDYYSAICSADLEFSNALDSYAEEEDIEKAKNYFASGEKRLSELSSKTMEAHTICARHHLAAEENRDICKILLIEGSEDTIKKKVDHCKEWLNNTDSPNFDYDAIIHELENANMIMYWVRNYYFKSPLMSEERKKKLEDLNKELVETYAKYRILTK